MFDFSKLGDMSKMLGQARQIQERQERFQQEQMNLLKKISNQLDEIIDLLKK
jgi:hypothetical protein